MEIVATRRVFQLAAMFALIGNTFLAARPTKRMKPIQIEQLQLRKNLNRYLIYISNSIWYSILILLVFYLEKINQGNVRNLPWLVVRLGFGRQINAILCKLLIKNEINLQGKA